MPRLSRDTDEREKRCEKGTQKAALVMGRLVMHDRGMWWYVLQTCVLIAVAWHSIYFEWNQNGYAVGAVAIGAAYCVTWLVGWLLLKLRRSKQETHDGLAGDPVIRIGSQERRDIGGRSGRP